jgi:hypothetical protein
VAAAKGKLAAMDAADNSIKGALSRRAQKGAVTRAKNKLAAARKAGTVKMKKLGVGFRKGKGEKAVGPVAAEPAKTKKKPAKASAGKREVVIPAISGSGRLAALHPQRQRAYDRATARQGELIKTLNSLRDSLAKARQAAIPASNPYSSLNNRQRKTRINKVASLEKTVSRLEQSLNKVSRARTVISGFAGSTKTGMDRYDNTARQSPLSPTKPRKPAKKR